MSLRRFEADTMPAALAAVRAALGPDAIILSNRRHDDHVEIIATSVIDEAMLAMATDAPAAPAPAPSVAPAAAPVRGPRPAPAAAGAGGDAVDASGLEERLRESEARSRTPSGSRLEIRREPAPAPTPRPEPAPSRGPAGVPAASDARPATPRAGAARARPAASRAGAAGAETAGIERIEARLQRLEVGLWGGHDSARAQLMSRLLGLGLGASLALRLAERANGGSAEKMLEEAFAGLVSTLPVVRDRTLERPGATLLAGPDAESRTDVLMKFAMRQVAAEGPRSLVLVSADAERPGAFEALEASGRDLGVATVRARGVADLGRTLDMFSDRALVLVDAGRKLPAAMNEDAAGSPGTWAVRRLVVLPATLQRRAACRIVREARDGRADGCVLSRLDADARPGEVLDALVRHWLGIAWWSDSDAPDATLERADAAAIVRGIAAAARRVEPDEDDITLGSLLHPGGARTAHDFNGPVTLDADAAPGRGAVGGTPGRPSGAGR